MLKKFIYCILWSGLMFLATFSSVLFGDKSFAFEIQDMNGILKYYISPLMMALTLFYLDSIYGYHVAEQRGQKVSASMMLVATPIVLIGFTISLIQRVEYCYIGLGILWIALTYMRCIVTEKCPSSGTEDINTHISNVIEIKEN